MIPATLLLVEDEPLLRESLAASLKAEGHFVLQAATLSDARSCIASSDPEVVLSDIRLSDGSGLELLDDARSRSSAAHYLFMTGHANVQQAVDAMEKGAFTYLTKPVRRREAAAWIEKALTARRKERLVEVDEDSTHFIGESTPARKVLDLINFVATSPTTVLLLGETGTGKDLLARMVHARSGRRGRFVPVNTATLSETLLEAELFGYEKGAFTGAVGRKIGLVEAANGGTLFLDEIGELSPGLQARLLRLLDTGAVRRLGGTVEMKVDVRFVAASNRDLREEVRQKRFREDLYYRLSGFTVEIPPLRERRMDIPALAAHFGFLHGRRLGRTFMGLTEEAQEFLARADWPGNIREFSAAIERAILLASSTGQTEAALRADHFHGLTIQGEDEDSLEAVMERFAGEHEDCTFREARRKLVRAFETAFLSRAVGKTQGNLSEAARRVGLDRKRLAEKLRRKGDAA
ncbi:MAG: sigma-54 dependent transcriptional regulator [Candidatus Hydrogenedentota bacterium]